MSTSRGVTFTALLMLLATVLAACPQALAYGKGDRVTTRVYVRYPVQNRGPESCRKYENGRRVGKPMRDCRLDIIWEEDSGKKIVTSKPQNCCITRYDAHHGGFIPGPVGTMQAYEGTHTWSGNWKVRAEFHWHTDDGPDSADTNPVSAGAGESSWAVWPTVLLKLFQG